MGSTRLLTELGLEIQSCVRILVHSANTCCTLHNVYALEIQGWIKQRQPCPHLASQAWPSRRTCPPTVLTGSPKTLHPTQRIEWVESDSCPRASQAIGWSEETHPTLSLWIMWTKGQSGWPQEGQIRWRCVFTHSTYWSLCAGPASHPSWAWNSPEDNHCASRLWGQTDMRLNPGSSTYYYGIRDKFFNF